MIRPNQENGEILKAYVQLVQTTGRFPNCREVERLITSDRQVRKHFGGYTALKETVIKFHPELLEFDQTHENEAKVLVFDIETAPITAHVWGLWENNVSLNQIVKDWHVLSWSAKWLGNQEILYKDQRKNKNVEDDTEILKGIWKLLDEADVVITQNGKSFDVKKLNARFALKGMKPPSSFRHIDICRVAKKHFGFSSHKLEYMTDKLCKKYKKLKHKKFQGHELWTQCLAGNLKAWKEMEKYNKYDVLSLEELYYILIPWDNTINFDIYTNKEENICKCGSKKFVKKGFYYTASSKYQRYQCIKCYAESRDNINLLPSHKKDSLKRGITR